MTLTAFDTFLDTLSIKAPSNIRSVQTLNDLIKTRNLIDIWHLHHPTERAYSFFAHVHKTYTGIDYFLISSELLPIVVDPNYHNIVISHHSPVSMVFKNNLTKNYNWRFNPSLLNDQEFIKYLNANMDMFLATNDNGEVLDSTLWETFKVVMRGHIISFESSKKKILGKRLKEIENKFSELEEVYRSSLLQTDLNEILKLRYEYNTILNKRISNLLLKLKQRRFEFGDKPEKLLANQLRGEQAKRAIQKVIMKSGKVSTNPKEINTCFTKFYKDLYSSKIKPSQSDFSNFFNQLSIPQLDEALRDEIDSPISENHLSRTVQALPLGKTAGPDGFGNEFYKAFQNKITPLIL